MRPNSAWPDYLEILADGYAVHDEARVLRSSIETPAAAQRQSRGAAFTVRGVRFLIRSDADFNAAKTWFQVNSNSWFGWTDPEDSVTRPARVRGGGAAVRISARVRGGRRRWRGECEIEGWRLGARPADGDISTWPARAAIQAADFAVTDDRPVLRYDLDDGAIKQIEPFSTGLLRRDLVFQLESDAALVAFRAWALAVGGAQFLFTDPADGGLRRARIRGGLGGLRYTARVRGGRRIWLGQCQIEGRDDIAPPIESTAFRWGAAGAAWGERAAAWPVNQDSRAGADERRAGGARDASGGTL